MAGIDWYHLSSLAATLERAVRKDFRFWGVIAKYPCKSVVPTLNIDLVWHTYMLLPKDIGNGAWGLRRGLLRMMINLRRRRLAKGSGGLVKCGGRCIGILQNDFLLSPPLSLPVVTYFFRLPPILTPFFVMVKSYPPSNRARTFLAVTTIVCSASGSNS